MLNTIINGTLTLPVLLICLGAALILGILTALVFNFKSKLSPSLFYTLTILPVSMCIVTMMVNGNLGLAISVAGGFTLVRFRSIAGNGKDISAVFIVMAIGVLTGMGYIVIAILFFIIVALTTLFLNISGLENTNAKLLKITLPDNYDYEKLFDDIFAKYEVKAEIEKIKTTNLGSLIEVTYRLNLPEKLATKSFLDDLRTKNANLEILLTSYIPESERL